MFTIKDKVNMLVRMGLAQRIEDDIIPNKNVEVWVEGKQGLILTNHIRRVNRSYYAELNGAMVSLTEKYDLIIKSDGQHINLSLALFEKSAIVGLYNNSSFSLA